MGENLFHPQNHQLMNINKLIAEQLDKLIEKSEGEIKLTNDPAVVKTISDKLQGVTEFVRGLNLEIEKARISNILPSMFKTTQHN